MTKLFGAICTLVMCWMIFQSIKAFRGAVGTVNNHLAQAARR